MGSVGSSRRQKLYFYYELYWSRGCLGNRIPAMDTSGKGVFLIQFLFFLGGGRGWRCGILPLTHVKPESFSYAQYALPANGHHGSMRRSKFKTEIAGGSKLGRDRSKSRRRFCQTENSSGTYSPTAMQLLPLLKCTMATPINNHSQMK